MHPNTAKNRCLKPKLYLSDKFLKVRNATICAVIGMLELALKRADHGELDRSAIEVAYSSANDLLDLIGDILDIARIESGRLSLNPERANLRRLVESVLRVFDGLARQKDLELVLELDSRISADVLIDPLRFKQILSNFGQQRHQVHPDGANQGRIAISRKPQPATAASAHHRSGQRHRHQCRRPATLVRAVRPGR